MFSIRIFNSKESRTNDFKKVMSKVVGLVKKNSAGSMKILSDNSSLEVVSGSSTYKNGDIVTELLIKKTIVMSKEDFQNDDVVENFIKKISDFCSKANTI